MTVTIARTLDDACAALAADPEALVLAGGTDLMVEVNRGDRSIGNVVAIDRVRELRGWTREGDVLRIGAGMPYAEMADPEFAALVPALIALDAVVELRSSDGGRHLPLDEFVVGVKANALDPGELITAVRVPVLDGPQEFLKVGPRNAMVISVASVALVVDPSGRAVRVGLGSVGPVPLRATEAEVLIAARIDWEGDGPLAAVDVDRFGDLVADAARPIDDHRGTAAYRRHAIGVMARRALVRAFGAAEGEAA